MSIRLRSALLLLGSKVTGDGMHSTEGRLVSAAVISYDEDAGARFIMSFIRPWTLLFCRRKHRRLVRSKNYDSQKPRYTALKSSRPRCEDTGPPVLIP